MSTTILRTSDAWWVQTTDPTGAPLAHRLDLGAQTTAELLADRTALDASVAAATAADSTAPTVDPALLDLVSPVSTPCRVVAQMTNYVSHVKDSGMDPETVPCTFFRKASHSISGPNQDVIRPAHVGFLDYEIEIGLVFGTELPVGSTVTADTLGDAVAGLVITNDVSARDIQMPQTQFYEAKSYPTFTPTGPALVLVDSDDLRRFTEIRMVLTVNGETRQDSSPAEMVYTPVEALNSLLRFQPLSPGDLLLTGTPGGTALKSPGALLEKIGGLLPPTKKWSAFFTRQAKEPRYLNDGDVMELRAATADGVIDLGVQRTTVRLS
ncbi:fumarylacetoacetate hydrolase family protein [Corynebacterium terpenotabidum]|uniref:Fumarylacetoacetate (FAA) hydrolase n=1 Tax=Corynebacterium terpenotabidum Y-11 TaxID=1200352 RepID=S4XBA9_9CORY|nr:fumarylacetoacetate hydrolase family protein [Corynebacterium terpenotabidum]AGP29886.1 fumarylacetoacetate (FAA) hydrolase [Corynebacterium terpenotabidum Y-11]